MSIVSLNPGPLFNTPGFNQTYTPVELTASEKEIKERFRKEEFSKRYDWPPDSPVAEVYDIQNSPAKMVLLNNKVVPRSASHLRGQTDRVEFRVKTPDPDRHSPERYPKKNPRRHLICKESTSPKFIRKPKMEHMLNRFNKKATKPPENDSTSSDEKDRRVHRRRRQSPDMASFTLKRRERRLPISMQDNTNLLNSKVNKNNASYLWSISQIYDVSREKEYKQWQYKSLVLKEVLRGFHTQEECQKYMRYLDGPRKRPFTSTDQCRRQPGTRKRSPPRPQSSKDKPLASENNDTSRKDSTVKTQKDTKVTARDQAPLEEARRAKHKKVGTKDKEREQHGMKPGSGKRRRAARSAGSGSRKSSAATVLGEEPATANDVSSDRPRKKAAGAKKTEAAVQTPAPDKDAVDTRSEAKRTKTPTESKRKITFLNEDVDAAPVAEVRPQTPAVSRSKHKTKEQSSPEVSLPDVGHDNDQSGDTKADQGARDGSVATEDESSIEQSTSDAEMFTLHGAEGTTRPKSRLGNRQMITNEECLKLYGNEYVPHKAQEVDATKKKGGESENVAHEKEQTEKKPGRAAFEHDEAVQRPTSDSIAEDRGREDKTEIINTDREISKFNEDLEETDAKAELARTSDTIVHFEAESDEEDIRNGNSLQESKTELGLKVDKQNRQLDQNNEEKEMKEQSQVSDPYSSDSILYRSEFKQLEMTEKVKEENLGIPQQTEDSDLSHVSSDNNLLKEVTDRDMTTESRQGMMEELQFESKEKNPNIDEGLGFDNTFQDQEFKKGRQEYTKVQKEDVQESATDSKITENHNFDDQWEESEEARVNMQDQDRKKSTEKIEISKPSSSNELFQEQYRSSQNNRAAETESDIPGFDEMTYDGRQAAELEKPPEDRKDSGVHEKRLSFQEEADLLKLDQNKQFSREGSESKLKNGSMEKPPKTTVNMNSMNKNDIQDDISLDNEGNFMITSTNEDNELKTQDAEKPDEDKSAYDVEEVEGPHSHQLTKDTDRVEYNVEEAVNESHEMSSSQITGELDQLTTKEMSDAHQSDIERDMINVNLAHARHPYEQSKQVTRTNSTASFKRKSLDDIKVDNDTKTEDFNKSVDNDQTVQSTGVFSETSATEQGFDEPLQEKRTAEKHFTEEQNDILVKEENEKTVAANKSISDSVRDDERDSICFDKTSQDSRSTGSLHFNDTRTPFDPKETEEHANVHEHGENIDEKRDSVSEAVNNNESFKDIASGMLPEEDSKSKSDDRTNVEESEKEESDQRANTEESTSVHQVDNMRSNEESVLKHFTYRNDSHQDDGDLREDLVNNLTNTENVSVSTNEDLESSKMNNRDSSELITPNEVADEEFKSEVEAKLEASPRSDVSHKTTEDINKLQNTTDIGQADYMIVNKESTEKESDTNDVQKQDIPDDTLVVYIKGKSNEETQGEADRPSSDEERTFKTVHGREGTTRPKSRLGNRPSISQEPESDTDDNEDQLADFNQQPTELLYVRPEYIKENQLPSMDSDSSGTSDTRSMDSHSKEEFPETPTKDHLPEGDSRGSSHNSNPEFDEHNVNEMAVEQRTGLAPDDPPDSETNGEWSDSGLQSQPKSQEQRHSLELLRSVLDADVDSTLESVDREMSENSAPTPGEMYGSDTPLKQDNHSPVVSQSNGDNTSINTKRGILKDEQGNIAVEAEILTVNKPSIYSSDQTR